MDNTGKKSQADKKVRRRKELGKFVKLPAGVSLKLDGFEVVVTGHKGTIRRILRHPTVALNLDGDKVMIKPQLQKTKRQKTLIGSFASHIRNMIDGVTRGHMYKLKICSGHFPMNVAVQNNQLVIKNFLGEKVPRKVDVRPNTTVKVEGQDVIIESTYLESASQMAADIEKASRLKNRDMRIFQDGIFITHKDGQEIG